jgi:hypothetical protein
LKNIQETKNEEFKTEEEINNTREETNQDQEEISTGKVISETFTSEIS